MNKIKLTRILAIWKAISRLSEVLLVVDNFGEMEHPPLFKVFSLVGFSCSGRGSHNHVHINSTNWI